MNLKKDIMEKIKERGIEENLVKMNVGEGKFMKVKEEEKGEKKMNEEIGNVQKRKEREINEVNERGGSII